jgi:fumarylacetoacetate (FAA) hydrolase family protein
VSPTFHSDPGLPTHADHAVLVGRLWRADRGAPALVAVRRGEVVDIPMHAATVPRSDAVTPWTYGVGALPKHPRGARMQS